MTVSKKLLVLNAGSSSLKFKLYDLLRDSANPLRTAASGLCERIGDAGKSQMQAKLSNQGSADASGTIAADMPNHSAALSLVMNYLEKSYSKHVYDEIKVVGHRVVHGIDINQPVLITQDIIKKVEQASSLAPLHNPPNLMGIAAASAVLPSVPQVAVFDTAFHQTMAPDAYMYALPYELYEQQAIRKYGFHGQSYAYLTSKTAEMLNKPESEINAIMFHLGAGSSMCVVQGGKSIDCSMGMTPLEGLMMGSRCGDLDAGVVLHLAKQMPLKDVDTLLNKKSGWLGLAGSIDVRSVMEGARAGDARCELALKVYVRRVRKYLGAFAVHLGGEIDALVFSAGVGENSDALRKEICRGLEWLGVELDDVKNKATHSSSGPTILSTERSRVKVLMIPTDEEASIAKQALHVVESAGLLSRNEA